MEKTKESGEGHGPFPTSHPDFTHRRVRRIDRCAFEADAFGVSALFLIRAYAKQLIEDDSSIENSGKGESFKAMPRLRNPRRLSLKLTKVGFLSLITSLLAIINLSDFVSYFKPIVSYLLELSRDILTF